MRIVGVVFPRMCQRNEWTLQPGTGARDAVWQSGGQPGVPVFCNATDQTADEFHREVLARVDFADPEASLLLTKPSGKRHFGGVQAVMAGFDLDDVNTRGNCDMLLNWILAGGPTLTDPTLASRVKLTPAPKGQRGLRCERSASLRDASQVWLHAFSAGLRRVFAASRIRRFGRYRRLCSCGLRRPRWHWILSIHPFRA